MFYVGIFWKYRNRDNPKNEQLLVDFENAPHFVWWYDLSAPVSSYPQEQLLINQYR